MQLNPNPTKVRKKTNFLGALSHVYGRIKQPIIIKIPYANKEAPAMFSFPI